MKRVIYTLKRKYPQPVTLCRTSNDQLDFKTGLQKSDLTKCEVKRAVILPAKSMRDFAYDLSYIAANKNFTYGSFFDHRLRIILVDQKDVTGFTLDNKAYVIFNDRRYEIKEIKEYEETGFWAILIDGLAGAKLLDDVTEPVASNLGLNSGNQVSS